MRCAVSGLRNGADRLPARDKTMEEHAEALRLIVIFVVGDGGFVRAAAAKLNRWVVGIHNSLDPRTAKKVKKLPERLREAQKIKFLGAE